ncbi:hypothetical protein ASG52_22640 [Methylobacterium sp. Leaf456]|uniref:hypothetical protein n=1 Tax=Methylobacterium sp. Leaf456 TaxID=1736382 RepID=UPI0006FBB4F2|nr:hypothetical protein [Methylobacterium sp. Leaf456]KQT58248.1 hypothetical protein ASG52_22640 [Methylobacterium sp. Leaf456]
MSRLEIRLRQQADGTVERFVPGTESWVPTQLGPDMDLGGETLSSVSRLFFAYLHAPTAEANQWNLRLSQQRKIGASLYRSLFGTERLGAPGRWMHIVPTLGDDPAANDRFVALVCRLPWCFLPSEPDPAALPLILDPIEPTVVTVGAAPECRPREWFDVVRFPSVPRLLLVAPEASDADPTAAAEHIAALHAALDPYYAAHDSAECIRIVKTFDAFAEVVGTGTFDPHIVYFYGHGETSGQGTQFRFKTAEGHADPRSVDELRQALDRLNKRTGAPPLVWFNACLGAAADQDSALTSLAPASACVITTRTIASAADARRLAETALPLIVTQGYAPHSALGKALNERPPAMKSASWANLVISAQYRMWAALGPASRRTVDAEAVGDFPAQLDRIEPLNAIAERLVARLGQPVAGPEVVLWRGGTEQGLDVFEDRVAELLLDEFPQWQVNTRRIELQANCNPAKTEDRAAQFKVALLAGLLREPPQPNKVPDARRICDILRNIAGGRRNILALEHGPFKDADLGLVQSYLDFWSGILELLGNSSSFHQPGRDLRILLGFSFEDEQRSSHFEGLPGVATHHLLAVRLPEIEAHLGDYREFYFVPPSQIPAIAQDLIAGNEGRFVKLRSALETMAGFKEREAKP